MSFKINYGAKQKTGIFTKKEKPVKIAYATDEPNIEIDAAQELTELQKAFRVKAQAEKATKDKNLEGVFWSCIVFKSQEQRDELLQLLGIFGSDEENVFLNGQKLLNALKGRHEDVKTVPPGKFKVSKDILSLSMQP